MASAKVGSPMTSCQVESHNWMVIGMELLPYLSSTIFMSALKGEQVCVHDDFAGKFQSRSCAASLKYLTKIPLSHALRHVFMWWRRSMIASARDVDLFLRALVGGTVISDAEQTLLPKSSTTVILGCFSAIPALHGITRE